MPEQHVFQAGVVYAAAVFVAGFAIGLIRVLWVAPLSGDFAAFILEAPVMLAISWTLCGWTTERVGGPTRVRDRVAMGAVALVLLSGAETLVATIAAGGRLAPVMTTRGQPAMFLGLVTQVCFALCPVLRRPPEDQREL
jgi:hypothetical protein